MEEMVYFSQGCWRMKIKLEWCLHERLVHHVLCKEKIVGLHSLGGSHLLSVSHRSSSALWLWMVLSWDNQSAQRAHAICSQTTLLHPQRLCSLWAPREREPCPQNQEPGPESQLSSDLGLAILLLQFKYFFSQIKYKYYLFHLAHRNV